MKKTYRQKRNELMNRELEKNLWGWINERISDFEKNPYTIVRIDWDYKNGLSKVDNIKFLPLDEMMVEIKKFKCYENQEIEILDRFSKRNMFGINYGSTNTTFCRTDSLLDYYYENKLIINLKTINYESKKNW